MVISPVGQSVGRSVGQSVAARFTKCLLFNSKQARNQSWYKENFISTTSSLSHKRGYGKRVVCFRGQQKKGEREKKRNFHVRTYM